MSLSIFLIRFPGKTISIFRSRLCIKHFLHTSIINFVNSAHENHIRTQIGQKWEECIEINAKDWVKIETVLPKKTTRIESKHRRSESKMGRTDLINGKDRVKIENVRFKKNERDWVKTQKVWLINGKEWVKVEKVRLKKTERTESKHRTTNSKMERTDSINEKDLVKKEKVRSRNTADLTRKKRVLLTPHSHRIDRY